MKEVYKVFLLSMQTFETLNVQYMILKHVNILIQPQMDAKY